MQWTLGQTDPVSIIGTKEAADTHPPQKTPRSNVQKAVVSPATDKGIFHETVLIKHRKRSLRLKQRKPRLRIRTVTARLKTQSPWTWIPMYDLESHSQKTPRSLS
jgi:hypothetical protein